LDDGCDRCWNDCHGFAVATWGFAPRCGLSFELANNMLELSQACFTPVLRNSPGRTSLVMRKSILEEMRRLAKKRGGRCVSRRYINSRVALRWRCGYGHQDFCRLPLLRPYLHSEPPIPEFTLVGIRFGRTEMSISTSEWLTPEEAADHLKIKVRTLLLPVRASRTIRSCQISNLQEPKNRPFLRG
jgi:hypothetical protein